QQAGALEPLELVDESVTVEVGDQDGEHGATRLGGLLQPRDPLVGDAEIDHLGRQGPGTGADAARHDHPNRAAQQQPHEGAPPPRGRRRRAGLEVLGLAHVGLAVVVLGDEHGVLGLELALRHQPRRRRHELRRPELVRERDGDEQVLIWLVGPICHASERRPSCAIRHMYEKQKPGLLSVRRPPRARTKSLASGPQVGSRRLRRRQLTVPKELVPMNRTALAAAALAALVGLSATACSGGGGQSVSTTVVPTTTVAIPSTTALSPTTTTAPAPTTVTIHPLFVRTGAGTADGGVGQEIVTMEPTTDHSLRVDFSEDEVAGLG